MNCTKQGFFEKKVNYTTSILLYVLSYLISDFAIAKLCFISLLQTAISAIFSICLYLRFDQKLLCNVDYVRML